MFKKIAIGLAVIIGGILIFAATKPAGVRTQLIC